MKKSTRALAGLAVLELFLFAGAAGMLLMLRLGIWEAPEPAKAATAITTVAGGTMGIVAAVLLMAWFTHKKNGN